VGSTGAKHVLQPRDNWQESQSKGGNRYTGLAPQGFAISGFDSEKADGQSRQDDNEQKMEVNDARCREAKQNCQPVRVAMSQPNQGTDGRIDCQGTEGIGSNVNGREDDDGMKAEDDCDNDGDLTVEQLSRRAV
jgi:hypothetical protein